MDLVSVLCGRSPFVVGILTTTGEVKDAHILKPEPPRPSKKKAERVWQPLSRRVEPRPKPQAAQPAQKVIQAKPANLEKLKKWESLEINRQPQIEPVTRKGQWRAIRVFISSTFVDTHGERDMLIRHVFPEVNKMLRSHYVRVIPVDLRWGVNDTQHIQATCLDYIDQCRANGGLPWFISLRTQRYGWVQTNFQNPQDFTQPENLLWLKDFDVNSTPLSITNMEVFHAFLGQEKRQKEKLDDEHSNGTDGSYTGSDSDEGDEGDDDDEDESPRSHDQAVPHSFFMFRNESFVENVPRDRRWIFDFEYRVPKDPSVPAAMRDQYQFDAHADFYRNQLKAVNQSIRASSLPKAIFDYSCNYESSTVARNASGHGLQGTGSVGHLEGFRDFLVEQLSRSVMAEYPSQGFVDRRTMENAAHMAVIEERAALFVGRQNILDSLRDYCLGESASINVVTGEPGWGKSAILAKLCLELQQESNLTILPHIIGATANSTDLHQLLTRICSELKALCPKELGDCNVPTTDFAKLSVEWVSVFLAKAGAAKRVVVVIDDLDGLTEQNSAHSLAWLPKEVPSNVRIVVSCQKEGVRSSLQGNTTTQPTENLSVSDRSQLVSTYLATYNKSLNTAQGQMSMLLGKKEATLPLYLVIAADALRRFGVYEKLNEYLVELPQTVPGLLRHIIQDLETVHGPIVRMALSLIACSRGGLLESDLVFLLDSLNLSTSSTWGTLFEAMRGFLSGGDSGFVRFFHGELKRVIEDRYSLGPSYATEEKHHQIHLILANYFADVCEKEVAAPGSQPNAEQAFDVIYHLLEADQPKRARNLLLRMDWLYARVRYGGPVAGLLQDVEMYLKFVPRDKAIATLGLGVVLACPALGVDWRQVSVQLYSRLHHMIDHQEDLGPLLNPSTWTSSRHATSPCFMSVMKPGGPEVTRINRARLPLNEGGENTFKTKYCFSFYPSGRVGVINMDGGFKVCELVGHPKEVYGLRTFGQEEDSFGAISWCNGKTVIVWDLQAALKGRRDVALRYQTTVNDNVAGCAVVNGESIVVFWTARSVYCWQLGRNPVEVSAHQARLVGCYVLPGAERKGSFSCKAISFGRDQKLVVYDIPAIAALKGAPAEGSHYFDLNGHGGWVLGASLVQKSLLSWARDGSLWLWSLEKGYDGQQLGAHSSAVVGHHCFNEQKEMFTWDASTELTYWDLTTLRQMPLVGHALQVEGVVVIPGNEYAISYGRDRNLNLWNLKQIRDHLNGEAEGEDFCFPMKGHSDWVEGVLVLHEGRHALSWSRDKKLLFWDLATVRKQAGVLNSGPPSLFTKKMHVVAVNARRPKKGARKARRGVQSQRKPVRSKPLTVRPFVRLKGHTDWVKGAVAFRSESFVLSFGGNELLIWSLDDAIRVLNETIQTPADSRKGKQEQRRLGRSIFVPVPLMGHPARVQAAVVHVSSDSSYHALSISKDKTIIEWNLDIAQDEGRLREPMLKRAMAEEAMEMRRKARLYKKEFKEKARAGGKPEKKKKEKPKKGEDGEAEEAPKSCLFSNSLGHTKWITGAKFFKANTRTITWGKDSNIVLWDTHKQASSPADRHLLTLVGHTDFVRGVMLLDKGNKVMSWSKDNNVIVWNVSTGSFTLTKLQGHTDIILGCRVLDNEQKALSFSRDKSIRLWDLTNLGLVPSPLVILGQNEETAHKMWIRGVSVINVDGHERFLSWADDGTLKLWDAQRARAGVEVLEMTLEGHESKVLGCMTLTEVQTQTGKKNREFTSHALSFSADNAMILWDLKQSLQQSRSVCMQLKGHLDWVIGAKLVRVPATSGSRLLNRLLSWSRDGCMRLWDLGNLNEPLPACTSSLCELDCAVGIISAVAVNRSGTSVLCTSADSNDILVWDLKAIVGANVAAKQTWFGRKSRFASTLQGHTLPPTRLNLFAQDTRLLSVDKQTIMVWDLVNATSLWSLTFDTPISAYATAFGGEERVVVVDGDEGEEAEEPEPTPGQKPKAPGLSQLFVGHTDGTVSHVFVNQ